MKQFISLAVFCIIAVAVKAYPDGLIKLELDPEETVVRTVEEAVAPTVEVSTTEAPKPKKSLVSQGSAADRTRLLKTLLDKYSKKINPDDVVVKFGVSLIDFHVLEDNDAIESNVWLKQSWNDSRLAWDPKEFGGVQILRVDAGEVWKPDVTLYNSADEANRMNCWESNVLIYSTGTVLWVPPCKVTSHCKLSLRKEPYGENTCTLKFGSWTFDGFAMDLQFYKDEASTAVDDMWNTSGFEIVKNEAERHNKFYDCCAEPYPDLTFNLTIKRTPGEELFRTF